MLTHTLTHTFIPLHTPALCLYSMIAANPLLSFDLTELRRRAVEQLMRSVDEHDPQALDEAMTVCVYMLISLYSFVCILFMVYTVYYND